MSKEITLKVAEKTLKKINKLSKEDCIDFIEEYSIDTGVDDFEELSEKDMRVALSDELEVIIEDMEEENADLEEKEEEKKVKEEPKKEKKTKVKKEKTVKEPKPKKEKKIKDPNQQKTPSKKLDEGTAIELISDDALTCYLSVANSNYKITKSDVKVDIIINDNTLVGFDDGRYITLCINGQWYDVMSKYIKFGDDAVNYTIGQYNAEVLKNQVADLNKGKQAESDYTYVEEKKVVAKKPAKEKESKKEAKDTSKSEKPKKDVKKIKVKKDTKKKK
jgi:hypothetical protein